MTGNSRPGDLQSDTHLQSDTLPTALHGPVFANSEDPDEMQHNATFHLGFLFVLLLYVPSQQLWS